MSLVRYSAGIVEWTKEDLDATDRRTRQLMTMLGMLHPRANVSRGRKGVAESPFSMLRVAYSVNHRAQELALSCQQD